MTHEEIIELANRAHPVDMDAMNGNWCRAMAAGFLEVAQMRRVTDRYPENGENPRRETERLTCSCKDETSGLFGNVTGRRVGPSERRHHGNVSE